LQQTPTLFEQLNIMVAGCLKRCSAA